MSVNIFHRQKDEEIKERHFENEKREKKGRGFF